MAVCVCVCVTMGSHSFICHPHVNHTCLYSLHLPTKGWPGWVNPGDWSHSETNVPHQELNPDTVTHPSTNRARHRSTETNALLLRQTTSFLSSDIAIQLILNSQYHVPHSLLTCFQCLSRLSWCHVFLWHLPATHSWLYFHCRKFLSYAERLSSVASVVLCCVLTAVFFSTFGLVF